jgi:hypothetical protein
MRSRTALLLVLTLLCFSRSQAIELQPGFVGELITDELRSPTSVAVAADGRIFVTEKGGAVRIIENGTLLPDPAFQVSVDEFGERGLGSILLDPDFDQNGHLYIYYTVAGEEHNRVSRFTMNGNRAIPGSETILRDLTEVASTIHNGGTMRWGRDGKLYVATGEGAVTENSQRLDNELGKMLRLNKDGSIPTDNPFYHTATGPGKAIYALGLRNPFTFDIDPLSGRIFVNDVGLSDWEEVNEIEAGKNYGWPIVEGPLDQQTPPANYQDPYFAYSHDFGCAVVGGLAFNYPQSNYPAEIQNHYLFSDFCTGIISMIDLNSGMVADTFARRVANLTSLAADPVTGEILYTEIYTGKLWRIRYLGTGAPFISEQPGDLLIPEGEPARFFVDAVALDPLEYAWYRDGVQVPGADSSVLVLNGLTLADSGAAIHCQVFNQSGSLNSDTVTLGVTLNQRPVLNILSPDPQIRYRAGDTIWFSGEAVDPETGVLAAQHVTWKVDFHHDTHTHPVISPAIISDAGSFVVPPVGETDTNVWYRVSAVATDVYGMQGSGEVDIFPLLAQATFETDPPGLELTLDGGNVPTPYTLTAVSGTFRDLAAPEIQIRNDSLFRFAGWNSGEANPIDLVMTDAGQEFTARYEFVTPYLLGEGDGLLGSYFTNVWVEGEPLHQQIDPEVNFRFEWEHPVSIPDWQIASQLGRDSFSIRWAGELLAPTTGSYTFYFEYDDRVRFRLGDLLLLDRFEEFGGMDSVEVLLRGGGRYPIEIEYAEVRYTSRIIVSWKPPYFAEAIVPQRQLYSEIQSNSSPPPSAFSSSFVYPVPLQDKMYIAVHDVVKEDLVDVTVRDMLGRLVKQAEVPVTIFQPGELDISELRSGQLYLITIFNGGRLTQIKAMKY